jgi:non-ribosomal peptide synthetase-like protein
VHVHRGVDLSEGGWDLLDIGDDVTLGQDASVRLTEFDDGHLVVGPVLVGAGATVDTRAGLSPGSTMAGGSFLTALSWLPPGGQVPAGACWDGVPAAPAGVAPPAPDPAPSRTWSPTVHGLAQLAAVGGARLLGWVPLTVAALLVAWAAPASADRLVGWLWGSVSAGWTAVIVLLIPVVVLPISLLVQALALRLAGPVPRGVLDRWGPQALRLWQKTGAVAGAERWLSGSLFWPPWLRLAGMRIGRRSEISTLIDTLPETVAVGDESFFADGIYFCQPRYHRGTITVAETNLGGHTFLGNHAVVPAGHAFPDDYFVGVATVADAAAATPGGNWFGHPPMALPRRAVVTADRHLTYEPDTLRFATRLFWELARFALPVLPWALVLAWLRGLSLATNAGVAPATVALVVAPLATAALLALPCLAVVILKWLLLGRVRPGQHAFWSCWCGRWDFLYVAWSQWARGTLAQLEGTLLLNAFLRLTGMHIGRRVGLGAGFAQVVDPDMLHFAGDATVNCHFQAHSFEDRILKIGRIHIRAGATVGRNAVVFYGADVGAETQVLPHSVVMKGDALTGGHTYGGHPARPATGGTPAKAP